jgi:transcriptional regulator with XRE-family HTH domain
MSHSLPGRAARDTHQQSSQPFGEYLRDIRRQRRFDLKVVEEASGIGVARLLSLEAGAGSPNRRELRQLARAFHMSEESMIVKAGQQRLNLE